MQEFSYGCDDGDHPRNGIVIDWYEVTAAFGYGVDEALRHLEALFDEAQGLTGDLEFGWAAWHVPADLVLDGAGGAAFELDNVTYAV
jgi:hypothetical protein